MDCTTRNICINIIAQSTGRTSKQDMHFDSYCIPMGRSTLHTSVFVNKLKPNFKSMIIFFLKKALSQATKKSWLFQKTSWSKHTSVATHSYSLLQIINLEICFFSQINNGTNSYAKNLSLLTELQMLQMTNRMVIQWVQVQCLRVMQEMSKVGLIRETSQKAYWLRGVHSLADFVENSGLLIVLFREWVG